MWGQFGEIRAISHLFGQQGDGYYVEVGAHDGFTDSNSLYFDRRLGWKGICIEPHATFFPRLVVNRPNCICLDCAVWDEALDSVDFYATGPGGWSRIGGPGALPVVEIQHPKTRTLDSILEEYNVPGGFELLSIDVEGTEWHVLDAFDLDRWLPRIVIIEDLTKSGQFDEHFKARDYQAVKSWERGMGGSNVIYCREPEDFVIVDGSWGVKRR